MVFLGSADSFIAAECVFIQSRCLTRGLIAMICTNFDFQCRNHSYFLLRITREISQMCLGKYFWFCKNLLIADSSCCKSVFLSPMSDTKTQFLYSFPGSSHVFFLFRLLLTSLTEGFNKNLRQSGSMSRATFSNWSTANHYRTIFLSFICGQSLLAVISARWWDFTNWYIDMNIGFEMG